MSANRPKEDLLTIESIVPRGGEMGALIRSHDWSKTSVGDPHLWPQSLRTALSICLESKFPMCVWWGQDLTVFYNDAYIPFTALKHPHFLGKPVREQWAEIWHDLRGLTEKVLNEGESFWGESMLFHMTRKGFLEETYFTFSISPVRDESGSIAGMVTPCQETTGVVLSDRRSQILRDLGFLSVTNLSQLGDSVMRVLSSNLKDIPFALLYAASSDGKTANLVGNFGIQKGSRAAPLSFDLTSKTLNQWLIDFVNIKRQPEWIVGLRSLFSTDLPSDPYPELPDSAYVLPIQISTQELPAGFLVLGISSRLEFDSQYRDFYALICQHISTHLTKIKSFEIETRRLEALEEVDRAKTIFFNNVSHEVRTPLTLLLGPLDDLLSGKWGTLDSKVSSELIVVHRNALRLLKLINTLLDFSGIEAGRVEAKFQATDLVSVTQELVETFRSVVERAGLKLSIEANSISELVYVDREMWEKVVLNLMSNAFKYTHSGEIRVRLNADQHKVVFSVEDTGIGISESELPKVFQRFHRVRGASGRTHEGAGIGLSLVQELVKLHGGSLRVDSIAGEGSVFSVSIPLGKKHLPSHRIFEISEQSKNSLNHSRVYAEEAGQWILNGVQNQHLKTPEVAEVCLPNGKTIALLGRRSHSRKQILLADDNADMRDYIKNILTDDYEVVEASQGAEALSTIRKCQPDMVISDTMMPVMDGVELVKQIRCDPLLQAIPVILLSARAGEGPNISGVEIGANDYITKPFSNEELKTRVRIQLQMAEVRRKAADNEVMQSELQRLIHVQNEFSSLASHELKPLVMSLRHNLQMALDCAHEGGPSCEKIYQGIDSSLKQIDRLMDIVESFEWHSH